jgi:GNAT superfamily N-acetyltransferase
MEPDFLVVQATPADFERVGGLTFQLLDELFPELGYQRDACIATARTLLADGATVWSFIATQADGSDIGVVMLNECSAIYAGGQFGEISELYVAPDARSIGVGAKLISAAAEFGRERGWADLEVGAPSVPVGQRTVDFYLRNGFEEIGPRLDLRL